MHGGDVLVGVPGTNLTTTTMGITKLSVFGDDYFNDWYGRFFLGPLADNDFVIDDFDQLVEPSLTNGMLTFKPTMSSAVTAQDQFEAYPDFSPAEMNDAINLAIASVEEEALQDKRDETITVVSSNTYEYDLPAGFSYIQTIVMEQGTSGRYSTSLDTIDRKYWRILRGSPPKLWFDSNYVSLTAGRKLRLIGQQAPGQLTKDGDLCSVDQSYVIYQAKANLHLSRISELGDEHDKKMSVAQARAHEERRGLGVAGVGEKVSL
tara:strand:- start:530 stop:1318 length:789 start_codon:yes stop_codon:yes gene_type:complete